MRRAALTAAGIALLVVALYAPFAGNGFLYDDGALVLEPRPIAGPTDLLGLFSRSFYPTLAYYRPLASGAYLIERGLLGSAPWHFHLVNAVLAGLVALAAWALLRLPRLGLQPMAPPVAALLFLVHPVASSCALPVSGRDTLLVTAATLFAVRSFCLPGARAYLAGLAWTAAALLTKEVAVALPPLVLAADLTGMAADAPGRSPRRWVARYGPLALCVGAYLALRHRILAGVPLGPGSAIDSVLSVLYTLQVGLAPFRALLYEPPPSSWLSLGRGAVVAVLVVVVIALARIGSGAFRRRVAFWSAWFLVTLAPSANLLAQETRFDERYAFLPLIALVAIGATAVSEWWGHPRVRLAAPVASVLLLALLAGMSVGRGRYWEEEAFYRQWAAQDPQRATAYYNLGNVLARHDRLDEAIAAYERAVAVRPDYGDALNNLGAALVRRGRHDLAFERLREAVRVAPGNSRAHNNLGQELARRDRSDEAEREFLAALALDPRYADAHFNLATLYIDRGDFDRAVPHLEEVVRLEPGNVVAENNLGGALASSGRLEDAMRHFRRAVELNPFYASARANLGHGLVRQGRIDEAIAEFHAVLERDPGYADAHYGLATAHLAAGRLAEARAELRETLKLDPDHAGARALMSRIDSRLPPD